MSIDERAKIRGEEVPETPSLKPPFDASAVEPEDVQEVGSNGGIDDVKEDDNVQEEGGSNGINRPNIDAPNGVLDDIEEDDDVQEEVDPPSPAGGQDTFEAPAPPGVAITMTSSGSLPKGSRVWGFEGGDWYEGLTLDVLPERGRTRRAPFTVRWGALWQDGEFFMFGLTLLLRLSVIVKKVQNVLILVVAETSK